MTNAASPRSLADSKASSSRPPIPRCISATATVSEVETRRGETGLPGVGVWLVKNARVCEAVDEVALAMEKAEIE